MQPNFNTYLLSIQGKLAPKSVEAARQVHNATAGAPANVAAARALSDLSHMVFVPVEHEGHTGDNFLVLDQWSNLDGLGKFFADPHVQEGGAQIFASRDPVVWMPAKDYISFHFPAPAWKNDRFIGIVRGKVASYEAALKAHNDLIASILPTSRAAGAMSHEAYFRVAQPGTPEALEFFAVDVWYNAEGMERIYNDPAVEKGFMQMFAEEPSSMVWVYPQGEWVEW